MRPICRDRRGTTALEMGIIAVPFFLLVFSILDISRYAFTVHSLQALASMAARQVAINCNEWEIANHHQPYCSATGAAAVGSDPFTTAQKLAIAPFLYQGGLAPTVTVAVGAGSVTVTAAQPAFTMMLPIMGTSLNAPQKVEVIPF